MQINKGTNNQNNNVSNKYKFVDMPEVINLPGYKLDEAAQVLKRLTTLMASV